MSNPFRFVIVGSGNMCKTYLSAAAKLSGVKVVGVVSRRSKAPEGAVVEMARSLRELACDFDGVILATPNGVHCAGAVEAAALGKHVLTEKVLDITTENMDTMTRACREAGVRLGVMFQRRKSPDNAVMKRLLDTGALGRVYAADLAVKFYRDQAYYDSAPYRGNKDLDGGGPFIQQAAHNIDIYCWLFGMPDTVVSMLDTFCHDIAGEDHGVALLRHANGMIGTITASTACYPGFPARLAIHAEKGSVVMENDVITEWHVEGLANPSETGDFRVHNGASAAAVSDTAGHEAIIADFVKAVREGREPAVPADSARLATELVLRIYGSTV